MTNLAVLQNLRNRHSSLNVSEKYQVVDTMQVLDSLSDFVDLDSAKVRLSRRTGTKHCVTLDLKVPHEIEIGGDFNKVQIHLFNSYNGDGKLAIHFGLYRLVCANGLVLGKGIFSANVRHLKGPAMITALDGLSSTLKSVDVADLTTNVWEMDRIRDNTFKTTSIINSFPGRIAEQAMQAYLYPVRQADSGSSIWLSYNRIQEVIASQKRGMAGVHDNLLLMDAFMESYGITNTFAKGA